jgi:hypothetical protein
VQRLPEFPFSLTSELDDALARARAELRANEAAAVDEEATLDHEPVTGESGAGDGFPERLIMGHELLLEVRAPIEWLLALVRRLATGDPESVASIDRLTAAFHSRLAGGGLGVRVADALTGFGILIGALDQSVVMESATRTATDGIATLLSCHSAAVAAQLMRVVERMPDTLRAVFVRGPRTPRTSRGRHTF